MKPEEAYYHLLLLSAGFDDGYDAWLDGFLEAEDPLSGIVLDLASCGSDINGTISCLRGFCSGKKIDERAVSERIRLYLKDAFHSGKMDKEAVVHAMYRITCVHGDPGDFDFDLWGDLYYLEDSYALAEEGIIPWERFDDSFRRFLDDGIPVQGTVWQQAEKQKTSLFDRIRRIFKR